jgi:transcription elongation factor GreA
VPLNKKEKKILMNKQTLLTDEGLRKLESELEELKTKRRKEIAEKIKTARGFGDLSENSEYDEAKNEQAIVEDRISTLENMLKNVRILVDDDIATDHVNIGSKVQLYDEEFDEEIIYQIVGSTEVDPDNGKISDESPIGKALMHHVVNDVVEIETPGGEVRFKVLGISK